MIGSLVTIFTDRGDSDPRGTFHRHGPANGHGAWCTPAIHVGDVEVSIHVTDPMTGLRLAEVLRSLATQLDEWVTDQPTPDPVTEAAQADEEVADADPVEIGMAWTGKATA